MMATQRKPDGIKYNEQQCAHELFELLRKKAEKTNEVVLKIKTNKLNEMFRVMKGYHKFSLDTKKYFDDIFKWGITQLKRGNIITVIGHAETSVIEYVRKLPEPFKPISQSNITWDTNKSISNIYDLIHSDNHLIPSFQRSTAWDKKRDYIELAYSIFNSTPLGLMYFWEINRNTVVEHTHYKFKRDVTSTSKLGFKQVNINELKNKKYNSVIDGQQRITAINVIINGTFDGKKMYFNETEEGANKFKFWDSVRPLWNSVEAIYSELKAAHEKLKSIDDRKRNNALEKELLKIKDKLYISVDSLRTFYRGFFKSKLLAIQILPDIELAQILQVFLRANKFGKKLNPIDIMMSSLIGNAKGATLIRSHISEIEKQSKNMHKRFKLANVLKLISVYFTGSPKINHTTFKKMNESIIFKAKNPELYDTNNRNSWEHIKKSINVIAKILDDNQFMLNEIKSMNSLIPVIVWVAEQHDAKPVINLRIKNNILTYLIFMQLFNVFASGTDQKIEEILKSIKNKDFIGWKIKGTNKDELLQKLGNEIKTWLYNKDNSKIKLLLSNIRKYEWGEDATIEHINPQANGGSDHIWNLSLLPKTLNSTLRASTLKEKVDKIIKEVDITREKAYDLLLIDNEDNYPDETRIEKIVQNFEVYLGK